MLKQAALALLLANGLLLVMQTGGLDRFIGIGPASAQREPGRLHRQVNPGLVQIVPVAGAAAAASGAAPVASASSAPSVGIAPSAAGTSAASSVSAASAAPSITTASTSASSPAASPPVSAPLACLEAGPFEAADTAAAERSLRDAGVAPSAWQVLGAAPAGSFIVYMGRYADRQALQRKRDELTRLKVDTEDLRDMPNLQPGLSLGRFDSKASAEAAMARLTQQGVRTAQVVALRPGAAPTGQRLRVPSADAALQARLAGLRLPSGPGFLPCAETGAAASGASGASR